MPRPLWRFHRQARGFASMLGLGLVLHLASPGTEVVVARSTDGGQTFEAPVVVASDACPCCRTSLDVAPDGAVSLVWRHHYDGNLRDVAFARSADGGATFPEPGHAVASNLAYEANDAAVLSDGTLLVTFADYGRPGERRRLERQRDWLIASSDGGRSFSEPLLVSESCDGRGGWSSLAVSHSFGHSPPDRIFHVCAAPQLDGILLRYSDSLGEIWSAPVRVDRPRAPTRSRPSSRAPASPGIEPHEPP